MEPHTQPLAAVCRYFQSEFTHTAIRRLRNKVRCLYRRIQKLEAEKHILQHSLMLQNNRLQNMERSHLKLLQEYSRLFEEECVKEGVIRKIFF